MGCSKHGHDPDPRLTLANERTFLAWIRTALAPLAAPILAHLPGVAPGRAHVVLIVGTMLGILTVGLGVLGGMDVG